MKRVLSIFIAVVMVVASFSITALAADQVDITVTATQSGENQIIVDTIVKTIPEKTVESTPGWAMYLTYDETVVNAVSYEWVEGMDGSLEDNNVWLDPGMVESQCIDISFWEAGVEATIHLRVVFDIIGEVADGDVITFNQDFEYTQNAVINPFREDVTVTYEAPKAEEETTTEAPEEPVIPDEDIVNITVTATQSGENQIIVDTIVKTIPAKTVESTPGWAMYLTYDETVVNAVSYEWVEGMDGSLEDNNVWLDPGMVESQCIDISFWEAGVEATIHLRVVFDIIGEVADGDVITFNQDFEYTQNAIINPFRDDVTVTYVGTEAPVEPEPEYAAPSTAVAQARKGCEACGVAAGIRFLATIEKTDDLTGYGMRIEYNGNSVDVDSKVDYSVDGNVVTYTVVVTNAPVGAEFVVAPYAVYGQETIFATAGAYTYNA